MGIVASVGFATFPEQGKYVGKRVQVCFGYDTRNTLLGTIVRDDMQQPLVTIIRLDDGRHVLASECQYSTQI